MSRTHIDMTAWPSGLRRWLKAPVRKGVGSNPAAVNEQRACNWIARAVHGQLALPNGITRSGKSKLWIALRQEHHAGAAQPHCAALVGVSIRAQHRPHRGRASIASLWRIPTSDTSRSLAQEAVESYHTTPPSRRSAVAVGLAPKCAALMWMTPSESPPPPQGSARDKLHVSMRASCWIFAHH